MKKLGLCIAVFSMMLFTSCEKEDENTNSNVSLKERIIGTWDAERTTNFFGMDIKETGTMTFYKDGTGLEEFEQSEGLEGWEVEEEGVEDEEISFTWSINADNELTYDDEMTLANDLNQANKLEFSGIIEMEDDEMIGEDEAVSDEEMDGEADIDFDFGFDDIFDDLLSSEVTLKLTK